MNKSTILNKAPFFHTNKYYICSSFKYSYREYDSIERLRDSYASNTHSARLVHAAYYFDRFISFLLLVLVAILF